MTAGRGESLAGAATQRWEGRQGRSTVCKGDVGAQKSGLLHAELRPFLAAETCRVGNCKHDQAAIRHTRRIERGENFKAGAVAQELKLIVCVDHYVADRKGQVLGARREAVFGK